jgi:hypothetical protein
MRIQFRMVRNCTACIISLLTALTHSQAQQIRYIPVVYHNIINQNTGQGSVTLARAKMDLDMMNAVYNATYTQREDSK